VENTKRDIFKILTIVFYVFWGALIIPVSIMSFFAGISTVMLADNPGDNFIINSFISALVALSAYLFWGAPFAVIGSFLFSFSYWRKNIFKNSFYIILLPLLYIALAFLVLFLIFYISGLLTK